MEVILPQANPGYKAESFLRVFAATPRDLPMRAVMRLTTFLPQTGAAVPDRPVAGYAGAFFFFCRWWCVRLIFIPVLYLFRISIPGRVKEHALAARPRSAFAIAGIAGLK
jgi:hypothetical protein